MVVCPAITQIHPYWAFIPNLAEVPHMAEFLLFNQAGVW